MDTVSGPDPQHLAAPCPEWLLGLLRGPAPKRSTGRTAPTAASNGSAYGRRAMANECDAVRSAPEGARNDTLNRASFSLGQLVATGEIHEGEVYEALLDAALDSGLGEAEAQATIRSGLDAGKQEPRAPEARPPQRSGRGQSVPASVAGELVEYGEPRPPEHRDEKFYVASDAGNAERFVDDHLRDVRFVPGVGFLVWDGRHWRPDDDERVIQCAISSMRRQTLSALRSNDSDAIKFAIKSESAPRIEGMLKLARSNPRIVIKAEVLDCNPFLLNVTNGTLDLRTGELGRHRREDLLTHCLAIAYNSNAPCARWEEFLARILRVECDGHVDDVATKNLIAFVKRAAGYTLTGSTREHVLFELYGVGANGKSVFLGVLKFILGRALARTLPFTALLAQRNPSNDGSGPSDHIARLRGARMVESVEANEGLQFNEAMLKSLTGGDRVAARHLFRAGIEFDPQFKLWIATNHKPRIVGTDVGIWRRVRMLPFTQVIPEEERNPNLKDELIATEAEGILRWAVEGCLEWQRNGLGDSEAVLLATEEYRREQDVMGQFLDECCAFGPTFKVRTADLVAAFNTWAGENHEEELSAKAMADRLVERRAPVKRVKVAGVRGWCGIGLRGGEEDGRWND